MLSIKLAIFLPCVLQFGLVYSKNHSLTPFGKEVKKLMPQKTYDKVFAVNFKDEEEFMSAIKKGTNTFNEILGIPKDKSEEDRLEKDNKDIGVDHIKPDMLFHSHTFAIYKGFKDLGKLTKENSNDLAQKYVDKFNEAAEDLKDDDDFNTTFKALITAVANFMKSEGVTSEEDVKKCEHYFNQEFEKYKE